VLVNEKIQKLASQIFKVDPLIIHPYLIDLKSHLLTDKSSNFSMLNEFDENREMFYYQTWCVEEDMNRSQQETSDGLNLGNMNRHEMTFGDKYE